MAIIDCITYNGEKDLFDIRYQILNDYVDRFIVFEFDKTFSGKDKKYLFPKELAVKNPKIYYYPMHEEDWLKYKEMAESSPNTKGAEHWKTEFMQKECIKDCLIDLKDDDIVFIGDCDEIWEPHIYLEEDQKPIKLKLKVYTYFLNNWSSEQFWGTLVSSYKYIKNACLNHLRSDSEQIQPELGWHFTSLKDGLKRKLEDSYTKETYANDWVMGNLDKNIAENKDFLGRNFTFKVDEGSWPQYLKDNREKYLHLLR